MLYIGGCWAWDHGLDMCESTSQGRCYQIQKPIPNYCNFGYLRILKVGRPTKFGGKYSDDVLVES